MANPASQTAVGPMCIVAVEQFTNEEQRIIQDELALAFLPTTVKYVVRLTRWRSMRKMLIDATEKTGQGLWGSMLCRKRYIDDTIHETIDAIDTVVILGAGLDTRAYRMAELTRIPVFELDLPENIASKRARLHDVYGKIPENVRLVPIDFERQNLNTVLSEHGFRGDLRTFFVWEAVTQYLTEDAVRQTFDFLATAASGSRLIFTYIRQDFIDGTNLYGAAAAYHRFRVKQTVWHFGMAPAQVGAFLNQYNWRELEQMGSKEFSARYIQPTGRNIPVSEIERSVFAAKI